MVTHAIDVKMWRQWCYKKLVVLAGSAAAHLWQAEARLCPCLPFALSAGCEHAQCMQALLQPGDTSLSSPRKNRGRRPSIGVPSFLRRACSGQVMAEARNAERRLEGRAQKDSQSTAFAPAGPMRQAAAEALDISQSTDTCARSDAAARSISRASGQERGSHAALSVHGTDEACV